MPSDRLTELGIRKCACGPKQKKMTDGKGLFLLLHPNGSKYWRMKYQFSGKEKKMYIYIVREPFLFLKYLCLCLLLIFCPKNTLKLGS